MRKLFILLLVINGYSCSERLKLDDASLKINVSTANDACSCNDIAIAIMKEELVILGEVKRVGKKDKNIPYLDYEHKKRIDKHFEYYQHCKPIYELEGMGSKCANYKEADELDRKLSGLQKELGME